jgi:hypothetical protein
VFSIRVLRNIFVPEGGEVTGEGRNLHKEEHHDLSLNQILFE